jgi:uncharacterized protein YjgD (DUF1641 family)
MAQPIPFIVQQLPHGEEERLRDAPGEHTEAILSAFEVLQLMHDRGILNLMRGFLAAGGELTDIVTASLNAPESIRSIRNVLLLARLLSGLSPEIVQSTVDSVISATNRRAGQDAPGLLELFRKMRSENSRRGLAVAIDLIEALGKAV